MTEDQIRKTAELLVRYDHLIEDTMLLEKELRSCRFALQHSEEIHQNLLAEIEGYKKLDRLSRLEIEQWEEKYESTKDQIQHERKRKRVWQLTTVAGLGLAVLLAL